MITPIPEMERFRQKFERELPTGVRVNAREHAGLEVGRADQAGRNSLMATS